MRGERGMDFGLFFFLVKEEIVVWMMCVVYVYCIVYVNIQLNGSRRRGQTCAL